MDVNLTDYDLERYSRQILWPSFGEEGQKRLKKSHVVVAGVGGLGSPASMLLVAAGIGRLTIIDSDKVELSNLNRQLLHWDENIGSPKVISAYEKLSKLNPTVTINPLQVRINNDNVYDLIEGADLVIDAMDNMATRFLLNEACVKKGIPFIHGGVFGLMGEIMTIIPHQGPCLRCLFPHDVEGPRPFPVFGPAPSLIASLQVMEAIKLLAGFGKLLVGRLLLINGETMDITVVKVEKNPHCQVCGD
jgi:adenylyltransferase/sulfurtransferase